MTTTQEHEASADARATEQVQRGMASLLAERNREAWNDLNETDRRPS